jgi:TetR/AcrR family transcriptional regulator, mexJK operon transcriptional repressor
LGHKTLAINQLQGDLRYILSMSTKSRGRPLNPTLHSNILQVAGHLFIAQGYHETHMDAVAKAAGISKLSIYRRFANKDALFAAVIREKCEEYLPQALFEAKGNVYDQLYSAGHNLMKLVMSPEAMGVEAMLACEPQVPALREIFYENGPKRGLELMTQQLAQFHAAGLMQVADAHTTAQVFCALFSRNDIISRLVAYPEAPPQDHEVAAYVTFAVSMFIKAHQ